MYPFKRIDLLDFGYKKSRFERLSFSPLFVFSGTPIPDFLLKVRLSYPLMAVFVKFNLFVNQFFCFLRNIFYLSFNAINRFVKTLTNTINNGFKWGAFKVFIKYFGWVCT